MSESKVIICFAKVIEAVVEKQDCPACQSEQDFLCEFEEWYGWTKTCLNCGDSWMDGELCPRPFLRGWRKKSIESAKKRAEKAVKLEDYKKLS